MLDITDCQIKAKEWQINMPHITLKKDEILAITGPSGIGKSTFLHWLLGNTRPHVKIKGSIFIDGRDISVLPVENRHIGLLMQDVFLFPHLNVLENICFALPRNKALSTSKSRRASAMDMLEQIDLNYLAHRYPQQLSGGERSRVGLLRALANQPKVMLLDEPFAALDPATRSKVGEWAFAKLRAQHMPSIMVSHDIEDIPEEAKRLDLANFYQANT